MIEIYFYFKSEHGMAGWPHQCNGHELGQTLGYGERQGGLACCSLPGRNKSDTTGQLNNNNICWAFMYLYIFSSVFFHYRIKLLKLSGWFSFSLNIMVECMGFPGESAVKNLPASVGDTGDITSIPGSGQSSGGKYGSILTRKISWTEKPGRLQSMGSQRVGHYWVIEHSTVVEYACFVSTFCLS